MPTFWDLYFHFIKWNFSFNSLSYLPILGTDKITGRNCFVGSQKMHLAPVVISNSNLFWSSKCGSGATHTCHIHVQDVEKSTNHLTFTPTRPLKILETFHIYIFFFWDEELYCNHLCSCRNNCKSLSFSSPSISLSSTLHSLSVSYQNAWNSRDMGKLWSGTGLTVALCLDTRFFPTYLKYCLLLQIKQSFGEPCRAISTSPSWRVSAHLHPDVNYTVRVACVPYASFYIYLKEILSAVLMPSPSVLSLRLCNLDFEFSEFLHSCRGKKRFQNQFVGNSHEKYLVSQKNELKLVGQLGLREGNRRISILCIIQQNVSACFWNPFSVLLLRADTVSAFSVLCHYQPV